MLYSLVSFLMQIVDSVEDYLGLMKEIFDFGAIKKLLDSGLKVVINSMHGGKLSVKNISLNPFIPCHR